jgi:hypothetical protein
MSGEKLLEKITLQLQQEQVDEYSNIVDTLVDRSVRSYCKDLDDYLKVLGNLFTSKEVIITDLQLEDIILRLPQLIYWASEGQEILGIKEDIAKSLRNDGFIKAFLEKQGSISQRNLQAEMDVLVEEYTQLIYSHACKKIKLKVTYAMEMLQSAKKILSKRMEDSEWVKEQGINNKQNRSKKDKF